MKKLIPFALYFFFGILIVFAFKFANGKINAQKLQTPLAKSSFSLNVAPPKTLKGQLVSLFGNVGWQSRTATDTAKITKPRQIQQGEKIVTEENSSANVLFPDAFSISFYPKTDIDFIQTLPQNIVLGQNSGAATYADLNSTPLSVRTNTLLINIKDGEVVVSDSELFPFVMVSVKSGSITAAYNSKDFVAQVVNVDAGNQLIFDTDTKTVDIESL